MILKTPGALISISAIASLRIPRAIGGPLKGELRDFWRYRVGDYRILAKLEDEQLLVLVVKVGHRSDVYGSR